MTRTVYKLFRNSEWRDAERAGRFAGSQDDMRDGFIHLSSASQVRGTHGKYFADDPEPVLAGFDPALLGPALKWETSRGGEDFPHLYGVLDLSRAVSVHRIVRDAAGMPVFPPEIP